MKVGLIGLGVMGRNHLRVLQESAQVSQILVFDKQEISLTNKTKVCQTQSVDEIISHRPDYVVVALPTAFHLESALRLAGAKIPTLIEKPVAINLVESELVAAAFTDSGTVCRVGHVERFNPALRILKEKIEDGVVGRPLVISTKRVGPFPNRISDVGVVRDLASHDIDLTMWLTGQKYQSLSSVTAAPRGSEFEDIFIALGRLEGGVSISHTVNWLTPTKSRETSILGTEGLLVADSLRAELRLFRNGTQGSEWGVYQNFRGVSEGEELRFVVPVREPLALEHEAMQAEILNPLSTEICTLDQGLEVMRVIHKVLGE